MVLTLPCVLVWKKDEDKTSGSFGDALLLKDTLANYFNQFSVGSGKTERLSVLLHKKQGISMQHEVLKTCIGPSSSLKC